MLKTPINHHLKAIDLAASAAEFAEQANVGFAQRFAPVLGPDEAPPDFLFAQELIARLLKAVSSNLKETGSAQTQQLVTTAALRDKRDRATSELRVLLRHARRLLDELLAPETARTVLRVRRVSNMKPGMLVQAARDVVAALRDPDLGLQNKPSRVFDAAGVAKRVEEKSEELAALLNRLAPQVRATQAELGAKVAEIEIAAETHRRCADFLYGLYRLAGLDFHADRLRSK